MVIDVDRANKAIAAAYHNTFALFPGLVLVRPMVDRALEQYCFSCHVNSVSIDEVIKELESEKGAQVLGGIVFCMTHAGQAYGCDQGVRDIVDRYEAQLFGQHKPR